MAQAGLPDEARVFFAETQKLKPQNLADVRRTLDAFVSNHSSLRRLALVTSGGTTVPFEMNTVRFLDNFSTGTRGATCCEQLLHRGYAVVLLHRAGSAFPFTRHAVDRIQSDPVRAASEGLHVAAAFDGRSLEDELLSVPFTTIFDYLFLLREACESLAVAGRGLLVMLAAAVSDFYIPEAELATDKIQSRNHDGLTLQLSNVPKLLGAVRTWLPDAFVLSFKLETNRNVLAAKAAAAIQKYGVDAVVSNLLQTRRDEVTIVSREPGADIVCGSVQGDEQDPVNVQGIRSTVIRRGDDAVVDEALIAEIVRWHDSLKA